MNVINVAKNQISY